MTFALANVAGIILHISALATIVVLWLVLEKQKWCICCRQEPDKRLGAPHGASTEPPRELLHAGQPRAELHRTQAVRQHMRDVS